MAHRSNPREVDQIRQVVSSEDLRPKLQRKVPEGHRGRIRLVRNLKGRKVLLECATAATRPSAAK
jgi:hypothetical protein